MYIEVTVDFKRYGGEAFDLRLSNYHSLKKMIDIGLQAQSISEKPREGYWVKVVNKDKVFPGHLTLEACKILSGDRLEII